MTDKSSQPSNQLQEEMIFSILSHPIRRKILKLAYHEQSLTFTTLKSTLGISTGSVYHHLDALGSLINQDQRKSYRLTDQGNFIVEKYLDQSRPHPKITKIDAFTEVTNELFSLVIDRRPNLPVVGILLILVGNVLSGKIDAVLFGPVIIPMNQFQTAPSTYLTLIYSILLFGLYSALLYIPSGSAPPTMKALYVYTLGLLPANMFVILIYLSSLLVTYSITIVFFALLNLLSQVLFLLVITAGTIQYQGKSVMRSVIISFVLLYTGLFINIII